VKAAAEDHVRGLLAALLRDPARTRDRINGIPLDAAMFTGTLAPALRFAMQVEDCGFVDLLARLREAGHDAAARAVELDEHITDGQPEQAAFHAKAITEAYIATIERDAGKLLIDGRADAGRDMLREADDLRKELATGSKTELSGSFVSASDLADMDLPAPTWMVPGLIPTGATILAGKPKCGKSWMALALGVAVASGGTFIGKYPCERRGVLYFALEDTRRRLKDRLAKMLHGERPPDGLLLATDAPRMPGLIADIERTLDARPGVGLVIVDTLQKVRAPTARGANVYEEDYAAVGDLKRLADSRGIAVAIVHHVRKAGADDVFETVSGSHGITGAADAMLVLKRNRAEADGELRGTGRDIEDHNLPVRFNPDGNWSAVEGADALPDAQGQVVRAIEEAGRALTLREIAERTGKTYDAAKKLVLRMREDGRLVKDRFGFLVGGLSL